MDEREGCLVARYPTLHNAVEIFAAMAGGSLKGQEDGMAPSEYVRQMLMSAQERFDDLLKKPGRGVNARASLRGGTESRSFKVSPRIVVFQQFAPGYVYNTTLTIRNVSKVSRRLRISRDPDPFFAVEYHGSNYSTVVAPGLVHVYNVRFSPAERRDYEYRVEFVVDDDDDDGGGDVFAVSVIAIGPRPVLDIPDQIEIPSTAVKIPSSRTIMVRNVGDAPAIFNFCSDHPCFSVEPSRGVLAEKETMQLTVSFLSEKPGDFKANLSFSYESGEKLRSSLLSSSVNCAIRIDRSSVKMGETYMGLSRSKVVTIHNRSDYTVRFQWMCLENKNSDVQRRHEYEGLFGLVRDTEVARCVGLVHNNICLPDTHELVCRRIYADEIASLMNENFRYNHSSFLLMPEQGEIWPRSCADITVIFRATVVGETSSVAYLEVTGREDRIPLSLHGIGKGPLLRLNVITIDLRKIYLCSVHNYEIVAANKGHINGTLVYKARPTDFGGTINVIPSRLILEPKEYKSFNLSFSSSRKGDFVERVDFVIEESSEVLSLHINGCIVCPTLHFDKSSLDFGAVALGFSKRLEVYLRNLSLVRVSFSATMMEDGDQAPLTHEEFARSEARASFPTNPREFTITPQKGVVEAYGSFKLKVTYTANVVRSGQSTVRVNVWDSDSDPALLPISFCGAIPALSVTPAEIPIRFSFLNFPYLRSINVENNSGLDGYFYIMPQAVSEDIPVVYSISFYQGFLKARQSKKIDITVITKVLGKQQVTLNMLTMGEQTPVTSCTIVCNGQGPVISVEPILLDFGDIQVLREQVAYFCIINDSPIVAHFKLTSDKKNVPWLVTPISGELGPNESTKVEVKICLRDPGRYAGAVIVQVTNSRSIPINVIASGTGSSVTFEPQIYPMFDMGFLFSRQVQSLPITVKNHGTHRHQVIWSNDPEMRVQRSHASLISKFQVEPAIVDVAAGGFRVVQCKIYWDANEVLTEDWYVFGHTHGQRKRKLLGTTTFKATFIEPRISFNKRELTFRIDICPNGRRLEQADELIVTNQSRLDLNVQLYVDPPFYLTADKKKTMGKRKIVLTSGTTATIPMNFSPDVNLDNPRSRNYSGSLWFEYNEHPNKEKIQCEGTVNFPSVTLPCRDVTIDCVLGSRAVQKFKLTNNGPVPVTYKFLWAGESIEIHRLEHSDSANNSEPQINAEGYEFGERSCSREENSVDRENEDGSSGMLAALTLSSHEPRNTVSEYGSLAKVLCSRVPNETRDKLRRILLPTEGGPIEMSYLSCLEDPEILALMDSALEPATRDSLDGILDIVPHEGTIVPYSSRYACFIFHGVQPLRVKVIALCEVLQGPTELVNVTANADAVRFFVDKRVIDFDEQLYGETCRSSFALVNRSAISFSYKINERNLISNAGKSDRAISALTVEPNKGSVAPLSSMEIEVGFQPTLLGAFAIELELQVAHVIPQIITVKGITSYPQVYPCVPRDDIFQRYSVELGYRAIQLLTPVYLLTKRQVMARCDDMDDRPWNRISEWDERILSSSEIICIQ